MIKQWDQSTGKMDAGFISLQWTRCSERAGGGKEPESHSLSAALAGAGLEVLTFDVPMGLGARLQSSL